ncbi:MAG: hypothetical protein K0S72_813, partial [Arthrobacter sp.]|nr:hypothetical protein [Arthrobacter sp.]
PHGLIARLEFPFPMTQHGQGDPHG